VNYYTFHIGDFIRDTVHLEPMQELCYRRLLDLYYTNEGALTDVQRTLSRKVRLDENLVAEVLQEFFQLDDSGWKHKRCDEEIARFYRKSEAARAAGKASAAARSNKRSNGRSTDVQRKRNGSLTAVEQPSTTQYPVPISTEEDKSSSSRTDAKASWSENGAFEISDSLRLRLQKAYPACDVERQAARAHEWLIANPAKRKKDHHRFLVSWLGRAQERGGDVASTPIGGRNARFGEVLSALDHAAQNPVKREAPPGWRDLLLEMAEDPDMVPATWEECYPSVQKYALELYERKGEVA